MSIKTLRRVSKLTTSSSSMPGLFESRWDAIKSYLPSLPALGSLIRGARKSAGPEDTGIISGIKEFFAMNAPSFDLSSIAEFASKLKTPLIVAVGIAAVAAIIYLVYKVYTNRESVQKAISDFVADIKNVAPDLTAVPGWLDSIRSEVTNAFALDSPASIVERLVKIKSAILGHQKTINHAAVGSGLLHIHLIREMGGHKYHGHGGGIKAPLY